MSATQEKVNEALKTLETGVSELMSSESWIAYLETQARFHNYSFGNTMLIMIQCPEATQVAGYKAWQKLGRQVRKGERGLSILAPMMRKAEDENTGETRRWVSGFKVVSVFDISQTDGEPLPESPVSILDDGNGDEALHSALIAQIESAGFTYSEGSTKPANGYTEHLGKRVVIDESLPFAQKVKTTAHELAHVILHDPKTTNYAANRGLCEVEAESVAYVVLHAMGYDAGAYSLGYIAGWSEGKPERVRATAERVQKTAAAILDTMTGASKSKQSEQTTAA